MLNDVCYWIHAFFLLRSLVYIYCDQVLVGILLVIDIGMRLFSQMALHMIQLSPAAATALKTHFLPPGGEQDKIHVWAD